VRRAPQLEQKPRRLHENRSRCSKRTVRAPKLREAVARDPTPKAGLELTLDEPWQPSALNIPDRLGEKGREVRLDGPVEQPVLGLASLVDGRAAGHDAGTVSGESRDRAGGRRTRIGWKAMGLESR
jgi:hypothetical protein